MSVLAVGIEVDAVVKLTTSDTSILRWVMRFGVELGSRLIHMMDPNTNTCEFSRMSGAQGLPVADTL